LSHSASPFLCWAFLKEDILNYLPRLGLNHNPPDLCLQSNKDYRHEPPVSAWS
jgi:hypothetical protein